MSLSQVATIVFYTSSVQLRSIRHAPGNGKLLTGLMQCYTVPCNTTPASFLGRNVRLAAGTGHGKCLFAFRLRNSRKRSVTHVTVQSVLAVMSQGRARMHAHTSGMERWPSHLVAYG